MPRIYASNADPVDFCTHCFPASDDEVAEFMNWGDGPDGRGNCFSYDAEHPSYIDCDDYTCYSCGCRLTGGDDYTYYSGCRLTGGDD